MEGPQQVPFLGSGLKLGRWLDSRGGEIYRFARKRSINIKWLAGKKKKKKELETWAKGPEIRQWPRKRKWNSPSTEQVALKAASPRCLHEFLEGMEGVTAWAAGGRAGLACTGTRVALGGFQEVLRGICSPNADGEGRREQLPAKDGGLSPHVHIGSLLKPL